MQKYAATHDPPFPNELSTNGANGTVAKPGSSGTNQSVTLSAGTFSGNADSIMDFAKFVLSKAFITRLTQTYTANMTTTLQDFLVNFVSQFYHNIYYIPTLHNNYCIVVKPECMFVAPPTCNVIYPQMKSSMNFTRNFKSEPTRALLTSPSIADLFRGNGANESGTLNTLVYLDLVGGSEVVKGLNELTTKIDLTKPLTNTSNYENKYGVRLAQTHGGTDMYLYLLSKEGKTNDKGLLGLQGIGKDEGVAAVLLKLAKYFLLRSRYEKRPGSLECIYNPYILPGFPMVSIEGGDTSTLNVYAYVTDVIHSLSPSGFSTTVSFNATHIANEAPPEMFPIVEPAYMASDPYTGLIGGGVTAVKDVNKVRKDWAESDTSLSTALLKVWRPLTTLEEHMSAICDGAKENTDKNYVYYTGDFFNDKRQAKIKAYTETIMSGTALSEADVR